MSAMGPKEGKTVKELINQIERFDEFLAPPQGSSEHKEHIKELLDHLRNIDEVDIPEERKLEFAKEVADDYLQYEDCVRVIKAATREIYIRSLLDKENKTPSPPKEVSKRPPPPNFSPRDPTKPLPNKPSIEHLPIHFLKPGSVRQLFNDYFVELAEKKSKIKEIKDNICDPVHGVASQMSAYSTAKYSEMFFKEIVNLDKAFQKQIALMPKKMKESPIYEQELKAQKKIFRDVCRYYLQIREKIADEFKETNEPKQFLDAGKEKIHEIDKIFEKYISKEKRAEMYAGYGFTLPEEKSEDQSRKKGPPVP
ncbi:MAG: hypothetical protein JSR17_09980 [Proteobacteria bacterium]|nr:hypothetical protein [Pseudomonadota bacterium]